LETKRRVRNQDWKNLTWEEPISYISFEETRDEMEEGFIMPFLLKVKIMKKYRQNTLRET